MGSERFICSYWDKKKGTCTFNRKEAMKFLKSVGAVVEGGPKRSSVNPSEEWSEEDWKRYYNMMNALASGIGALNLPTGIISCGEGDCGVNPYCNQWTCKGRQDYEKAVKKNPSGLIIIRR